MIFFLPNMMPLSLFCFFFTFFTCGCRLWVPQSVHQCARSSWSKLESWWIARWKAASRPASQPQKMASSSNRSAWSTKYPSSFHVAFFLICFTSFYLENIDWEQLSWLLYWLSSCLSKLQSGVRSNTDIESSVLLLSLMEKEAGNNAA